ncbi:hypothetical protein PMI17_04123 [Pantoea sp. GM01]|nr:hypothetical protein PMI17_04123 [Pantoea sp. GM01]
MVRMAVHRNDRVAIHGDRNHSQPNQTLQWNTKLLMQITDHFQ